MAGHTSKDANIIAFFGQRFQQMRGDIDMLPDATAVVPVNVQGDLNKVEKILQDITLYAGPHTIEIILVLNNFTPDEPPPAASLYRKLGINVICIPDIRRPGIEAPLAARMHGVEASKTDLVILFDADCRIHDATALIDWYVDQFKAGAKLAYTHVDYYELRDHWSIRLRVGIHHYTRWVKRVILGIPTSRGSNYAIDRRAMSQLYKQGYLAADLNVGLAFKSTGAKIVYAKSDDLQVLTSGRMYNPQGLYKVFRYFRYRLLYNLRVLPVSHNAHIRTKRGHEPVRKYDNNKQIK